jgi:indoleamine 2,3-dioxygenase
MIAAQTSFNPEQGFLPSAEPLTKLPADFSEWEAVASQLPKLLLSDQLQGLLTALPPFPIKKLHSSAELERAMMIVSFISHAYVWAGSKPASVLPATLAEPWYQLSQMLNRPPVLSYASYALHNWRRLQTDRPVQLGNIALLQNFWGGIDEEWFILIHVDIEARAIAAVANLLPAQAAVSENQPQKLLQNLLNIQHALAGMYQTLARMPEHCDPFIYYQRVRPFIHGWANNPCLPDGLLYEGVEAYQNKAQKFRGETGAQSSIIPALDALLGIEHEDDPLKEYLLEMRSYMPQEHRAFLNQLSEGPALRDFVIRERKNSSNLVEAYNNCVTLMENFRTLHLQYAASYIHQQSQTAGANPTDIGTGGTPFMRYLDKHKKETGRFLIDAD